jgi:hypothetical protein
MRKYLNVDIIAALGAVVAFNNESYDYDFYKYDVAMFVDAANNPDGENNRFLWLSRRCGTHCYQEREVYLKDTEAHNTWTYYAKQLCSCKAVIVQDRIHAYAVVIKGFVNKCVMGDLYELDYAEHTGNVLKKARPFHSSIFTFEESDFEMTLPYEKVKNCRESLAHKYGAITSRTDVPEDIEEFNRVLEAVRKERSGDNFIKEAEFTARSTHPKADWLAYIRTQIRRIKKVRLTRDDLCTEIKYRRYGGETPKYIDGVNLFDEFVTDELEGIEMLWGKI